ncbi:DUF4199 domain-containing protein [Maribacter sp. TH_r10]|uniref:DUF4199 domain-containing protein n=1 Tax=Maribacter sp. TH_r10 TaxID=3082086 RepID=UPI002954E0AD|nr:DUF4199 domain-containing protein [Maribacter sp. TH_r10]MDV7137937.1 DUF4199 domain-containing protein [Maribacter sp. TH_r10]|tara:strand:- start:1492 stop:1935 length:444 start_codon:yes stop_codon:yes gene_type:complete
MKHFALPVRFGIATSGCLIAYFLILSLFTLHTNVFFSVFNGVITGFGIYEAIKFFKIKEAQQFNYGRGFTAGVVTGGVASVLFTLFFTFYATEVNTEFISELSSTWGNEIKNFEAIVFFTVAIMGFATTLVVTLAIMQLFKSSKRRF